MGQLLKERICPGLAKSLFSLLAPIEERGKKENGKLTSHESLFIHLKFDSDAKLADKGMVETTTTTT